jgi:hypothetical protein
VLVVFNRVTHLKYPEWDKLQMPKLLPLKVPFNTARILNFSVGTQYNMQNFVKILHLLVVFSRGHLSIKYFILFPTRINVVFYGKIRNKWLLIFPFFIH